MSEREVSIGLIGAGRIAAVHAAAYQKVAGGRISTCTDPIPAASASLSERFGIAVAPSIDDILSDPTIDAVLLATPNALHPDQTIDALAAGKHVFCQKPIALTLEEADAVVAAAAASDRLVQFGFMLRFTPPIPQLQRRVIDGEIGAPIAAQVAIFGWEPITEWFFDPARGGGVILDTLVHFADLVIWMFGRARTVYTAGGAYKLAGSIKFGSPDNATITVRHESGVVSSLYVSWTAGRGNFTLDVHGAEGSAHIDFVHSQALSLFGNPPLDADRQSGWQYPDLLWDYGYTGEQQYFVDRIRGTVDGSLASSPTEARDALALVLAAQQSLDERRIVELP